MNWMRVLHFLTSNLIYVFFGLAALAVWRSMARQKKRQMAAMKLIKKSIISGTNEPLTLHPEIDPAVCAGCGACTLVCPEGDILQMINGKAKLVSPSKCVGHGECERACPVDAIKLVFGTKTRGMDIPRLSGNYETNVPGLYIAGELGGMGLIRNAIKQGVLAAQHALGRLDGTVKADYDLLIVGAGPAGLAASLVAIANGKSYLTLEQDRFGGTVTNFPRQKVVMSHPFDLPIVGKMKFDSNKVSKEQLLGAWQQVRKKTGLKILEESRFMNLKNENGVFSVTTSKGEFTARKVILAMGVRGSPRKLGVAGEDRGKVTYNLLDPEQYQGRDVVVVGGGNAGVEAAQMLGDPKWKNRVHLLVRGGAFDRCNDDNKVRITSMEKRGLVKIWFNSAIQEIGEDFVVVKKDNEMTKLSNQYVFIFAGAEMPHKFLMSLGVAIDKKFGEQLSS